MIDKIAAGANWFVGLFATGGSTLWTYISAVIPLVIIFLTFMNTLIAYVGQDKIQKVAKFLSKSKILSYTILPVFLCVLTTGTGCFLIAAEILPEEQKIGFSDAVITFYHPCTGLFPHVHAGEVWVYMGLATGLTTAGYATGQFAIRAFISAVIMMAIRGIFTEKIFKILVKRSRSKEAAQAV